MIYRVIFTNGSGHMDETIFAAGEADVAATMFAQVHPDGAFRVMEVSDAKTKCQAPDGADQSWIAKGGQAVLLASYNGSQAEPQGLTERTTWEKPT